MIIKILPSIGRSFKAIIEYSLKKDNSRLVRIENLPVDNALVLQKYLEDLQNMNLRVKDQVFHVVFSFPKEYVPSKEQEINIVNDYMFGMGYGEQPYAIFAHTDRTHYHLHVKSSRIDRNTFKKINDSYEKLRSSDIRDNLIIRYNMTYVISDEIGLANKISKMMEKVFCNKPYSKKDLENKCQEVEIKVISTKNGIMLQYKNEKPIKSSSLKFFKDKSLKSRINVNSHERSQIKRQIRSVISYHLTTSGSISLSDYCKSKGIEVEILSNSGGDYGVNFIKNDIKIKGSDIGYSYNTIKEKLTTRQHISEDTKGEAPQLGKSYIRGNSNLLKELSSRLRAVGNKEEEDESLEEEQHFYNEIE